MELCVKREDEGNFCKRKQKANKMELSKHTDHFKMSWSQKAQNIYIVLIRINPTFDLKELNITLTDQSCVLNAFGMRKYGWNFFLEVNSKVAFTNHTDEKLILSIAKKDPTLRWASFYKTIAHDSMCANDGNYNSNFEAKIFDEAPPEKLHITANHTEVLSKNRALSAKMMMSTGTVVTNGILKGGNRPIVGSLTTSSSAEQNLQSTKLVGPKNIEMESPPDLDFYHYLKEVDHEWHESDENGIVFIVHVSKINPWSLNITFLERELTMVFKTGCPKFHQKHKTGVDVMFCWKIYLSGDILGYRSEYTLGIDKLNFLLCKKNKVKWKTLFGVQQENQFKEGDGMMIDVRKPSLTNKTVKKTYSSKYTGLRNLGNTCFINSVVQCLANTKELRDYFLDKHYYNDLNHSNPLGMKGKMAESFYSLLQEICSGKHKCFAPTRFRQTVGLKAPQFIDYMQHDAQEFMTWLMDILHEDVNRVFKKPYFEVKEQGEESDSLFAQECWKLHVLRNDSFIVDLFHGMLKSKLVCPVCNKHSNKFDPFLFLPVPLPPIKRQLDVIFHHKEPDIDPVKISVWIPKSSGVCENILNEVAKVTGVKSHKMRIYEVNDHHIHKLLSPLSSSDKILSTTIIFVQEEMTAEECGESVYEIFVNQHKSAPDVPQHCVFCKKQASEGSIKRCVRCYKVGYCDQKCQRADWAQHRRVCRKGIEKLGLPFIVFIPHSKATYNYVAQLFYRLARKSVKVIYYVKDGIQSNLDEEAIPPHCGNFFSIDPINWSGENLATLPVIEPLDCDPNNVLDLSRYVVVAMVWQTDPKTQSFVKVTNSPVKRSSFVTQPPANPDLHDCIQLFTEPEVLTPNEAWYCPSCKDHREATKQLSLCKLPEVLIIQLKRFSFKNFLWRDKITTLIDFPIKDFDMSRYCKGEEEYIYDLYSVINHHGEIFGGHYTSYVYSDSDSKWRVCDDSQISVINSNEIVDEAAYVMFYQRRKSKTAKVKVPPTPCLSTPNLDVQKQFETGDSSTSASKASFWPNDNAEKIDVNCRNNTIDNPAIKRSIYNNTTSEGTSNTEISNKESSLGDSNEISRNAEIEHVSNYLEYDTSKSFKEDIDLQKTEKEINHMEIDDKLSKTDEFENQGEVKIENTVTDIKMMEIEFTDMDEID